ncbi:MAG TPA: cation:proton antiporter [Patescibacteria group bacterium]|nr:cation:proton antiporter [Patescibacteria group bacterium]
MHSLDFFWLMLIASLVAMLGRFVKIPYTIALVITGLFIGQLGLLPGVSLDPHVLFALFLPPLLFEAGIHIQFRLLRSLGITIGLLAFAGTLLSTALIGYGVHFLLGIPLLPALLFGAMISPTDPISVLAMFKKLGINKRLSLLVEAESLFNDGVAVVLFGVIQSIIVTQSFSLSESIASFLVTVLGGAGIGAAIGAVASRVTLAYDDHLLEITLTTMVAYGAYLAAESIHVSGVIAVVAASLVVGNYGMTKGMTPNSQVAVKSFWEYAAFVANSMVFLLVGLEIAAIPLLVSSQFIMIAIIVVLIARAISVYSLSAAAAAIGQHIPASWRHVLVWSGLRGALSMAMVLGIDPVVQEKTVLIPLIYGVVFFSLLGQGMTIEKFVAKLGLSGEK